MTSAKPYDLLAPRLWPKGNRRDVWAVYDCARDPQVWSSLYASSLQRECLYAGALHPALERVAPYLVQLELDDRHTIKMLNRGWGQSWGIFLKSGTSAESLRKHLRKFLRVRGPGGKTLVFRYYDPRVMRIFLPTCSGPQLDELFGPIDCIASEDANPAQMIEFKLDPRRQRLESEYVALTAS